MQQISVELFANVQRLCTQYCPRFVIFSSGIELAITFKFSPFVELFYEIMDDKSG